MTSRSQGPRILKHNLEKVMSLPPDNDHSRSLNQNGIYNHHDLLNIPEEDRVTLEYVDESNKNILLNKGYRSLVQIFQAYLYQSFLIQTQCVSRRSSFF